LEIFMGTAQTSPAGPDLTQGVPVDRLSDGGMLAGKVGEELVLLVQRGDDFFAVGATCSQIDGTVEEATRRRKTNGALDIINKRRKQRAGLVAFS
jgi:hypothetical protein